VNVLKSTKQTFWQGALLLTVAGLLSKILSALYRVPYQNIAGDIGFYIYQQVYPFYGIALAFSLYGFPVVISKMISEEKDHHTLDRQSIIAISFCSLMTVSIIIFVGLFQFSNDVAKLMGDPMLQLPIEMVSFSFLLLPFISVLRGYFQGNENMLPTALSQITEQFIRVGTILLLAYILVMQGFSLYEVGAGAIFGSLTGGFGAIMVLLFFQMRVSGTLNLNHRNIFKFENLKVFPFKNLIINSIAICLTGLTLVLLQLVDSFTLYNNLIKIGHSLNEAKIAKGVFDRGQPLLQLGVVLATSLSLSLVPAIARAKLERNSSLILKNSHMALKISILVGTGATIGLITIMKYTNQMLFVDINGTYILSILSITILFTSISLTALAILQGLGYVTHSTIFILIGVTIKWILNSSLIPIFGSLGAAFATVLSVGVISILSMVLLHQVIKEGTIVQHKTLGKVAIAGSGMYLLIKSYEWLFFSVLTIQTNRITSTIFSLSSVLIGGITFAGILFFLRIFNKDDVLGWPALNKWIKK
jgi:PST family polysaccharide transporter